MNRKIPLMFAVAAFLIAFCLSAGCVDDTPTREEVLRDTIDSLTDRLNTTTQEAQLAADVFIENPTADNGRQVLATLYQRTSLTHDILIADDRGIVQAVYPDNIHGALGSNLSSYPPDKETFLHQDVYVSAFMQLENGMEAYLLSVPVEIGGEYAGYISLSFDPYRLFGAEQQKISEDGYNLWVMQTDGVQVYDPDVSEAGVNLLTNPDYASVLDMTTLVASTPSGETTYLYTADTGTGTVSKTAVWDTLTFGGRSWRVVLTESAPASAGQN